MQIELSWKNPDPIPLTLTLCLLCKLLVTAGLPKEFCPQRESDAHSFIQQVFIEDNTEVLLSQSLQSRRERVNEASPL